MEICLEDIESFEYVDIDYVYDIEVEDNHNYFLSLDKQILVHNSGKTWSVLQWLLVYCLTNTGKTITIGRDKMTTLKETLFEDFKELIRTYDLRPKINRSEMFAELNGNLIRFVGVNDDIMGTHGLRQDIFFLNEVISISKDTFDQLEQRTNEFFICDLNPSVSKHWSYDLEKRDDVRLFSTTVLDNPFAPAEVVKKILSYEPTAYNIERNTADEYKWQVYGLGNRASREGAVFPNVTYVQSFPDNCEKIYYGMDFGYTVDPTTLVRIGKIRDELYIEYLVYEPIDNAYKIAQYIDRYAGKEYIVADVSGAGMIGTLRQMGYNMLASMSKLGIEFGIDIMKRYKLHVIESTQARQEFENYLYVEGTNKPIDKYNHGIDATRYVCMHWFRY